MKNGTRTSTRLRNIVKDKIAAGVTENPSNKSPNVPLPLPAPTGKLKEFPGVDDDFEEYIGDDGFITLRLEDSIASHELNFAHLDSPHSTAKPHLLPLNARQL